MKRIRRVLGCLILALSLTGLGVTGVAVAKKTNKECHEIQKSETEAAKKKYEEEKLEATHVYEEEVKEIEAKYPAPSEKAKEQAALKKAKGKEKTRDANAKVKYVEKKRKLKERCEKG